MVKPGSGCASSSMPCGGTVPQEWRFGSMSGASTGGASTAGSSATRSSPRNERSGRNPVATTILSTFRLKGRPANVDSTSVRSEEHTSELQSLMRNSYAVFCLTKKKQKIHKHEI